MSDAQAPDRPWHVWRYNPPPRDTMIEASRVANPFEWRLVKTCKQGCCVYDPAIGANMILPCYWREAPAT